MIKSKRIGLLNLFPKLSFVLTPKLFQHQPGPAWSVLYWICWICHSWCSTEAPAWQAPETLGHTGNSSLLLIESAWISWCSSHMDVLSQGLWIRFAIFFDGVPSTKYLQHFQLDVSPSPAKARLPSSSLSEVGVTCSHGSKAGTPWHTIHLGGSKAGPASHVSQASRILAGNSALKTRTPNQFSYTGYTAWPKHVPRDALSLPHWLRSQPATAKLKLSQLLPGKLLRCKCGKFWSPNPVQLSDWRGLPVGSVQAVFVDSNFSWNPLRFEGIS